MNNSRCLCCGKALSETGTLYHSSCARHLFGSSTVPTFTSTQEELNTLAKETILSRVSVPGVQPKLSLHLEKTTPHTRLTLVGLSGEYILKPQSADWPHLPEAEHFCMLLAKACRIETVTFGLIQLQSGEYAYLTRRMDRENGSARHMEDFCQILNKMTFQKYQGSMEQISRALRTYSDRPGLDSVRYFELALFSFITGNSDMHLKNFSLLNHTDGHWELSPAYDLLPVKVILPEDHEEMALTLNGKKNHLKCHDFKMLGKTLLLTDSQIEKTLHRVTSAVQKALSDCLSRSFLPEHMRDSISICISERLNRLK